jgi:L-cysteine:1D-myo-inositol 2-amino-2-deoxy-alpha-D-glucopyranoside ligase
MVSTFAERGGDPGRAGKRDPLDSLVWSARRDGEPWWDSPFGPGRPGWHVECVAISRLGGTTSLDLQGGGSDLVFPHHQMCASVARALDDSVFARHFAHTGMVALDGEKMSKSKGNLEFVSRLRRADHDPRAIRLALMAEHYRADWEWTTERLEGAEARLTRWHDALARPTGASGGTLLRALRDRLADDLDAPSAIALIDAWCDATGDDADAPALVRDSIDALLGIDIRP